MRLPCYLTCTTELKVKEGKDTGQLSTSCEEGDCAQASYRRRRVKAVLTDEGKILGFGLIVI